MSDNGGKKTAEEQLKDCKESEKKLKADITDLKDLKGKKSKISTTLIVFGAISIFIIIVTVIGVFCSINQSEDINYNLYLFLYGSIMAVSLTVLIIFICNLLVKIWSKNEEE